MSQFSQHEAVFKAFNEDEHLVFSEVYAPMVPDSDGDMMDAATIKKMAYDFMRAQKLNQIDVQHDNNLNPGASVIESFIARKGDPVFIEGAWVVGVHVPDQDTWAKIKKGEINGFSIEALVTKTPQTLELDIPPVINGKTTKSDDDHDHEFFVTFDANGKFMGGRTSISKGHFHAIRAGTVTDTEQGHNHRFSFIEGFQDPSQVTKSDEGVDISINVSKQDNEPVASTCKGDDCSGCADCAAKKIKKLKKMLKASNKDDAKEKDKHEANESEKDEAKEHEEIEKGGVGSGRKKGPQGPWVVHNEETGELHSVHSSHGKAIKQMDKLNDEHFNDPNTKPGLGGLTHGKYGAMSKDYWDQTQGSVQKDDDSDTDKKPKVVMIISAAGLQPSDDMGSFSGTATPAQIQDVHTGLKDAGFVPLTTPGQGQTMYHHPTVGVLHVTEETGLPKDDPRKFTVKNLNG